MFCEAAVSKVLPQLAGAELADEIDVDPAVAVHVGHRDPVAVVIVGGLVGLAGIVDDVVYERDAALRQAVGEGEVVERGRAGCLGDLLLAAGEQPGGRTGGSGASGDRWLGVSEQAVAKANTAGTIRWIRSLNMAALSRCGCCWKLAPPRAPGGAEAIDQSEPSA